MTQVQGPDPTIKVQTWGDDLRLPCFINPSETTGLLTELEPLRRPSLPFQSKHLPALKRNKWFVLRRPTEKVRSGLVVVWPEHQCCVYISGDPLTPKRPMPRIALLRIRIDPQFTAAGAGLTVFSATLMAASRRLAIEDTLIWKGRNLTQDEPFSARHALAVQWIEHYCLLDPRLLSGLEIEMAKWQPLDTLKPDHIWELQQEEAGRARYLWIFGHNDSHVNFSTPTNSKTHAKAPTLEPALDYVEHVADVTGPLIANASRDAGPEQWMLSAGDGAALGRALIRTLAVSERLRSLTSPRVRVEVIWNSVFSKWEIKGVSELPVTANSANFDAAK